MSQGTTAASLIDLCVKIQPPTFRFLRYVISAGEPKVRRQWAYKPSGPWLDEGSGPWRAAYHAKHSGINHPDPRD